MAKKVAVVGMKGIGNLHAQCHMNDELSELVAVCDVIKSRADEAAEKYKVKAYYDLDEMLRNEDFEILDVTTGGLDNGSWHHTPAMMGLQAKKSVLVEKPISFNILEAREMVTYAARNDLYLGCNLNHFFTEPARIGEQLIADGKIGEQVYCLQKMGFDGSEFLYQPPGSTRMKGMPYFHLKAFLAHPFSLMRHFCGDVTHIQAFVDQPGFRKSARDPMLSIASINMKFASGSSGVIISQRGDANFGLGGWWSFELAGTKGTFCIENCVEKITYWEGQKPGEEKPAPVVTNTGVTDFNSTFPNRIHAFMEDVTNNVPKEYLRASGRDALATLEYTWAVMESYEQGGAMVRPAPLPPFHGDPTIMCD